MLFAIDLQEREAIEIGHHHVEQDQVDRLAAGDCQRSGAIGGANDAVAQLGKIFFDQRPHVVVIIDNVRTLIKEYLTN